ncbi:hypothetical protein U1Q18_040814 [Sarracenia purpurea var. burkii]
MVGPAGSQAGYLPLVLAMGSAVWNLVGPCMGSSWFGHAIFLDEFRQAVLLYGRCGGPMGFDPRALLSAGYLGPAAGDSSTLGFYGCGGAPP